MTSWKEARFFFGTLFELLRQHQTDLIECHFHQLTTTFGVSSSFGSSKSHKISRLTNRDTAEKVAWNPPSVSSSPHIAKANVSIRPAVSEAGLPLRNRGSLRVSSPTVPEFFLLQVSYPHCWSFLHRLQAMLANCRRMTATTLSSSLYSPFTCRAMGSSTRRLFPATRDAIQVPVWKRLASDAI